MLETNILRNVDCHFYSFIIKYNYKIYLSYHAYKCKAEELWNTARRIDINLTFQYNY